IGPGGDPTTVPRTVVTQRLTIDDGRVKFTTTRDGATTTETATLTFCGAGLGLTYVDGPSAGTTRALGFDAAGRTLEILDANHASTYRLVVGTQTGIERPATGAACKQAPGVCGGLANVGPWVVEQSVIATAPVGTGGALQLETPYVMES